MRTGAELLVMSETSSVGDSLCSTVNDDGVAESLRRVEARKFLSIVGCVKVSCSSMKEDGVAERLRRVKVNGSLSIGGCIRLFCSSIAGHSLSSVALNVSDTVLTCKWVRLVHGPPRI